MSIQKEEGNPDEENYEGIIKDIIAVSRMYKRKGKKSRNALIKLNKKDRNKKSSKKTHQSSIENSEEIKENSEEEEEKESASQP